jgi:predicted transcriptional regulator of viral defense system
MKMKVRVKSSDHLENKESFVMIYLKEHEKITLHEFCGLVNISKRRALRILVSLRKRGEIYLHTTGRQEFYTLA